MAGRLLLFGPFIAVLVVLATLWTLVIWFSASQQTRLVEDQRKQLRLINVAVTQQAAAMFRSIGTDLVLLDHWLQSHPGPDALADPELARLTTDLQAGYAGLVSFGLVAEGGAVRQPGGTDFSLGRALALTSSSAALDIGVPIRDPRSGGMAIPVARALPGSTQGLVGALALVDITRFSALQDSLRLKPAGSVTLLRGDGTLLARAPVVEGLVGKDLSATPGVRERVLVKLEGFFDTNGGVTDGVARIVSYMRAGELPLIALVGEGRDDALATYRERRRVVIGICAAISLFALLFAALLTRSQRSMRAGRAELAAVSDASPLGLFRSDRDGRVVYANEAYLRINGLQHDDIAWGWTGLIDARQRDDAIRGWKEAVREAKPIVSVRRLTRRDGSSAVISLHTMPLRVDGELTGHVGTIEDITERVVQQKAQRTLSAIYEATTDAVAQLDPRGQFVYLNPAGRRRLGLAADAPVNHLNFEQFTPPHRLAQVRDEIMPTALAHGAWVGETSTLDHTGHEIAMSEMLIAHRGAHNKVEALSVIMRDITEEARARAELRRSEAILRIAADHLPAFVAVLDLQQRYVFTNLAFDRWRGPASEPSLGRTLRDVLGEFEYERSRPFVEAALAGRARSFQKDYPDRDGGRFLDIDFIPFHGEDGAVAGFVSVSQDITLLKREEQRLRDAAQTDALTGVINRAGFDERLAQALAKSAEVGVQMALLYIDLDHFKPVNDTHGHPVGDALLRAVAGRMRSTLRPSDVVARLGGDEFALILPGIDVAASAEVVARKIVGVLGEVFRIGALELHIGASVGVALSRPGEVDADALIRRADEALYEAKGAGRGRYTVAPASP